MGTGIAMACANAGLTVALADTEEAAIDKGMAVIRRNYSASVARGRLTQRGRGGARRSRHAGCGLRRGG